ncbi:MAG TPA: BlaI/MecI/CopY family transcriptional regulator, partial [Mycobacterium sp.]|nr:BlaI/MecI/CopY family transcriptional regulator [Mycobacterium sp.]
MRREPGRLEGAVIDVLATGGAMTVAQVRVVLGDRLAHTTVMTALGRLADKGLVTRTRRGRGYVYSLV